ncbi:class I SAM-dependent methyltransferase [Jatrophihabitans sp.]|uniref:class I SAM-dependent methyltransferase n=1 Tax=Jatrophihabitans sp. TaxID=1932789 RepID=UPI002D0F1791|nr:class I SAM-dependent methyltransferase [Jatrophihabitans sp.]
MDDASGASRTAVLVCQGRAAAHGRLAVDRFSDPIAPVLLRPAEREVVEQVRAGQPPAGWRDRMAYELVQGCAEMMVPRTVAIDDAVRQRAADQLVILGAGLDSRAWRLPELAGTTVIEVDHPASQADKLDRIGTLAPLAGSLRFAPVRFDRDELGSALAGAGHDPARPTTWLWEGVVAYLTRGQVRATVAAIRALSAPGSRLIVNYQQPAVASMLGRVVVWAMLKRGGSHPMAGEPWRSLWTPAALRRLLARHGFAVESDENLIEVAGRLGFELRQRRSTRTGRVLVADLSSPA